MYYYMYYMYYYYYYYYMYYYYYYYYYYMYRGKTYFVINVPTGCLSHVRVTDNRWVHL